jgi:hypothetical protein
VNNNTNIDFNEKVVGISTEIKWLAVTVPFGMQEITEVYERESQSVSQSVSRSVGQ